MPDVIVKKMKNAWSVSLNPDAMPKLRINRMYAEILQNKLHSGGQMSNQLQEARWLIKNVQQRFETILRVAQAIVERQRHFFDHGEVAMRPLVLREIAETLGLHESTVSRVTTQKFMATPRGIFELKYFFGSHVATETGGACSATAIRALLKQLVHAEDCKKPLVRQQDCPDSRRAGHRRGAPHHCQIPGIAAYPAGQPAQVLVTLKGVEDERPGQWSSRRSHPAIRDYVLSKLERIQRHFDQVIDINVILSVQKLRQKAEISVHMRGKDIHVESDDEDMYAAIDLMMDKLDRQIIKHKGKAYAHPHDALKRQAEEE